MGHTQGVLAAPADCLAPLEVIHKQAAGTDLLEGPRNRPHTEQTRAVEGMGPAHTAFVGRCVGAQEGVGTELGGLVWPAPGCTWQEAAGAGTRADEREEGGGGDKQAEDTHPPHVAAVRKGQGQGGAMGWDTGTPILVGVGVGLGVGVGA